MKQETLFNRRSITLFVAAIILTGLAMALTSSPLSPAGAKAAAAEFPSAGFVSKFKGDAVSINQFSTDLVSYLAEAKVLRNKPSRTPAELASLRTTANNLKGRGPQMKRLIQKAIDELKSGGHLGAVVDKFTEDELKKRNSPALAEIKASGGVTALLNQSLRDCDALPGDIDTILREVEGAKKASNNSNPALVPASFTAAPVAFKFGDCWTSKVAITWCTWTGNTNCREGAEKDLKKCQNALATT